VITNNSSSMERLGMIYGVGLVVMLAFTVVAPYAFTIKSPELIRQIDQTQNTIQNLCLILASFLFGTSVGKRMQESTIDTLAKTAQTAGAALSGVGPATMKVGPNEQAVAVPTDDGAEIRKEPVP
jgi:hypothetical protein